MNWKKGVVIALLIAHAGASIFLMVINQYGVGVGEMSPAMAQSQKMTLSFLTGFSIIPICLFFVSEKWGNYAAASVFFGMSFLGFFDFLLYNGGIDSFILAIIEAATTVFVFRSYSRQSKDFFF